MFSFGKDYQFACPVHVSTLGFLLTEAKLVRYCGFHLKFPSGRWCWAPSSVFIGYLNVLFCNKAPTDVFEKGLGFKWAGCGYADFAGLGESKSWLENDPGAMPFVRGETSEWAAYHWSYVSRVQTNGKSVERCKYQLQGETKLTQLSLPTLQSSTGI